MQLDRLGFPPQIYSTLYGLNKVMADLGFPRWTLVKWQVPPLYTFWLMMVLIMSGLKWFAAFQLLFILYKTYEHYGDPMTDWVQGGIRGKFGEGSKNILEYVRSCAGKNDFEMITMTGFVLP